VNVLTELGRVTWAVIKLEDYTEDLCRNIEPVDLRIADKRPVSQKIKAASEILSGRTQSAARDDALAWLERARQAIERRNMALHATPIAWVGREPGSKQLGLGKMPRDGGPYVEMPLTVESLSKLRSVLDDAAKGWTDLVIALAAESDHGKPGNFDGPSARQVSESRGGFRERAGNPNSIPRP
jgi:hypothetical protein